MVRREHTKKNQPGFTSQEVEVCEQGKRALRVELKKKAGSIRGEEKKRIHRLKKEPFLRKRGG